MNCDLDVKLEEDPLSRTEIKSEPYVSYKFYVLCYPLSFIVALLVESLPINPAALVRFLAGQES